MRTSICSAAIVAAGSLLLSACGDEQETKTETVVQTVRESPPAQTTGGQTTASDASSTGPAGPPLPDGLYGADGGYEMKVEDQDSDGLRIQSPSSGRVWKFTTTCDGAACAIDMRRELDSGGYKPVKLKPAEGRSNAYVGTSSSSYDCRSADEEGRTVATRQRYSVRLSGPAERKGRETAQSIDVYVTETTNKCGENQRHVVHYRGTREQ